MSKPPLPRKTPDELLAAVRSLSKRQLKQGVKKTEHFSELDEISETRKGRTSVGKTLTKIKQYALWSGFLVGLILVGMVLWLIFAQVHDVASDPQSRLAALGFIWNTFLIVGATLFVENVWFRKE